METIKISELEQTTDLQGLYTIGTDKNNLSKKVSLEFLAEAAEYANRQGDYAKDSADAIDEKLEVVRGEIEENSILIEDLQNTKIDKEQDDYYPNLSVGVADALSGVDVVAAEFSMRRSGGGAIADGVARVEAIRGNSITWNQQSNIGIIEGTLDNSGGAGVLYNTVAELDYYTPAINGRKVMACASNVGDGVMKIYFNDNNQVDISTGAIFTANTSEDISRLIIAVAPGAIATYSIQLCFYDLTLMYGGGREPLSMAEFFSRCPVGVNLISFNAGEAIDAKIHGIKSIYHNIWKGGLKQGLLINGSVVTDEAAALRSAYTPEYIQILPDTTYYCKVGMVNNRQVSAYIEMYDGGKRYLGLTGPISYGSFVAPAPAVYIRFFLAAEGAYQVPTAFDRVSISLTQGDQAWGENDKYRESVEDISFVEGYFRAGLRSAYTANDAVKYNREKGKWESIYTLEDVDLGSLTWKKGFAGVYNHPVFFAVLPELKHGGGVRCTRYATLPDFNRPNVERCITAYMHIAEQNIVVCDTDFSSVEDFAAAMAGVMLTYEVATPIVESVEEFGFNTDYQVWDGGVESVIGIADDNGDVLASAPLAASISYGFNAVGLIKQLRAEVAELRARLGM